MSVTEPVVPSMPEVTVLGETPRADRPEVGRG